MILSDAEKEYVHSMIIERMQQHYEQNLPAYQEEREQIQALGLQLYQVLSAMSRKEADVIQRYQDLCSKMSADAEILYYQCGFLDGVRLSEYFTNGK